MNIDRQPRHVSRRRFIELAAVGVLAAACEPLSRFFGTSPDSSISPSTPTESPEAEPITTAELSLVTDPTEREAFLNRLPGDRPEAQGGDENIAVFDFKFGNITLRGAYYQLTREAINEGVTITYRNKDGQLVLSLNTAAFYLEMLGPDNQRVIQRLIGISDPVVDPATGMPTQDIVVTWFYDPFGFPKSEKSSAVQLTIPVLGYRLPNGQGNPLDMWFIPLLGDGVVVPGYTPSYPLEVTGLYEGGVPEAFKVKATIKITPELGQVFKYFSQIGLTLSYEEEGNWSIRTENFGVQVPNTTLGDNALTVIIDTEMITIPLAEVPARLQTKDDKLLLLNSDGKQVLATFDPNKAENGWQKFLNEHDLNPNFTETVFQEFMGVEINSELTVDKSLDPMVQKVTIGDAAYTKFIARSIYKVWLKKGGPNGTGPGTETTFEEFMALWATAQKTNNPADWEKVQLKNIWANDLEDGNGYVQQPYTIWPMYTGEAPEGVRGIDKVSIVMVKRSKVKNITKLESSYDSGAGTNLKGGTMYFYAGMPNSHYSAGVTATFIGTSFCRYLIQNSGGSFLSMGLSIDNELKSILINGKIVQYP